MRIHFVVDGERDIVTIPRIVEKLLGTEIEETSKTWARLHGSAGKGYGRKLRYALLQARDNDAQGVAAIVDEDRSGKERLKNLQQAREEDRTQHPPFPTAIGLAIPHGEAWLLDDAEAVKAALKLSPDAKVPGVGQSRSPKEDLQALHDESPRDERPLEVWADIAMEIDIQRYREPRKTGFAAFEKEVEAELRPLLLEG